MSVLEDSGFCNKTAEDSEDNMAYKQQASIPPSLEAGSLRSVSGGNPTSGCSGERNSLLTQLQGPSSPGAGPITPLYLRTVPI